MNTPYESLPFYRFSTDTTWEQAARELVRWHHAAQNGHACPAPEGWTWKAGMNTGDAPYLHAEWGVYNADRGPDDDLTNDGAVVERDESGRWRWTHYRSMTLIVSGVDDSAIIIGRASDALIARAATWADVRDAVADCERWLDANVPEWRGGVVYLTGGAA